MNMKKVLEMKAKREDARLKAMAVLGKAEAEDRFLTDEESKQIEAFESEIRSWDENIQKAEQVLALTPEALKAERGAEEEIEVRTNPARTEKESRFDSFGEQMIAVYRAVAPGGKLDSRLSTRAASGLSEGSGADGGFLVQQDFVSDLLKRTYETGILAPRARKIPISSNSNGLKIKAVDEESRANGSRWGGVQAFWQGEADQLTGSRPKFRTMELSLNKLTGLCYATDELLEDAAALETVLKEAFAEEFGFKIDEAMVDGTGNGEPLGILKSQSLVTVAKESGQTAKLTTGNLTNMWNRLWSKSRSNAVWFINQELEPHLYELKIGDKPVYVPAGGLSEKPYATLFGRPVLPIEQCSAAGEVGDIILADYSQYLLIDKGGVKQASSIHVCFLYDEQVFRFIYRCDGQPVWSKPLTPYKGTATVSPFVALAKRNA
jgi:HK97 family phage major capsid protein